MTNLILQLEEMARWRQSPEGRAEMAKMRNSPEFIKRMEADWDKVFGLKEGVTFCKAVRVKWKRAPKWKWAVYYGQCRWPSYCEWLVPGTVGHL